VSYTFEPNMATSTATWSFSSGGSSSVRSEEQAPREDLIRANFAAGSEIRAEGDGRTLFGHFAVFNQWAEIDSWEGKFLEKIAPGAFRKTIKENRANVKVLYDHGYDPTLGNKPLGPVRDLREDATGAYYEVPLIDTDYNRDFVIPAAQAGLLGASFRFSVIRDDWNNEPKPSADNPKGYPERTIKETQLFEFGPVTFPAYAAATAGVRGRQAFDLWRSLDEAGRAELARLLTQAQRQELRTSETDADSVTSGSDAASSTDDTPADGHLSRTTPAERRQRLLVIRGVIAA
jgi:HK97 family phage prohead protease